MQLKSLVKKLLKYIDKFLGAIWQTIITLPWTLLATLFSPFIVVDELMHGTALSTISACIGTPLRLILTFFLGLATSISNGWSSGLIKLTGSAYNRFKHFFTHQLFFGMKSNESVNDFFKHHRVPKGFDIVFGTHLFGRITLKFLTLVAPRELYAYYEVKSASPHSAVHLFYTEQLLSVLKSKYADYVQKNKNEIVATIKNYISDKKQLANKLLETAKSEKQVQGRIIQAEFDLKIIQAAQNCVSLFEGIQGKHAPDIEKNVVCDSLTALCYVWRAIEIEGTSDISRSGLKEKLALTLYQIYFGYSVLLNDDSGVNAEECYTGHIGLLVRVLADESERLIDHSSYHVEDVTPANLSAALKGQLDRHFVDSSSGIMKTLIENAYRADPDKYKKERTKEIIGMWLKEYADYMKPDKTGKVLLSTQTIEDIVTAGVEAWEPPFYRHKDEPSQLSSSSPSRMECGN